MEAARLVYKQLEHDFATPRGNTAKMFYRQDTNDWNTIYASMTADEYNLKDFFLSGLAVDIGAYVGSVGIALALDNPDLHVICIEPVSENVDLIVQNIVANGLTVRIVVSQHGAAGPGVESATVRWRYRGSALADHHAFVGNLSLVEGAGATGVAFEEAKVPCISLSEIVEAEGPIDFLKIDCEGCEWSVLLDSAVADIPLIVGEWHPVGGRTIGDLEALLGPTHHLTVTGPEAGPGEFKAVRK